MLKSVCTKPVLLEKTGTLRKFGDYAQWSDRFCRAAPGETRLFENAEFTANCLRSVFPRPKNTQVGGQWHTSRNVRKRRVNACLNPHNLHGQKPKANRTSEHGKHYDESVAIVAHRPYPNAPLAYKLAHRLINEYLLNQCRNLGRLWLGNGRQHGALKL